MVFRINSSNGKMQGNIWKVISVKALKSYQQSLRVINLLGKPDCTNIAVFLDALASLDLKLSVGE